MRNDFAVEDELPEKSKSKEIDGLKIVEAFYKGFLDPAVYKFIDKYYKLPSQQNYKSGNKYKASYYLKWAGLEAFKKDMEGIFNKNAFKCNVSLAYIIYKTHYNYDNDHNFILGDDVKVLGHQIRYYHSSINHNALFEHPVEIHDRKTLNDFIHNPVIE